MRGTRFRDQRASDRGHVERFLHCFPFLALTKETKKKRQNPKEKSVTVLFALAKEPSPFTPLVCSSLIVVVLSVACSVFSFLFTPCVFPFEPSSEPSTRYVPFLLVFKVSLYSTLFCLLRRGASEGEDLACLPLLRGRTTDFFSFLCPLHVSPRLFVHTSFFSPAFNPKSFLVTRLWSCRFPYAIRSTCCPTSYRLQERL